MNRMPVRIMATVLVIWILVMPGGLAAGGRRGANLVITRLDGTRVSGELVAVKPGSLLLLTGNARDASVDLSDIKSVRIMRRSKAGLFAGIAGAAGLVGGALAGLSAWDDEEDQAAYGVIAGLYFGAIGVVSGLLVGAAQGIDSNFTVAGQREEILAGYWKKLAALSREGRLPEPPGAPAAGPEAAEVRSARSRAKTAIQVEYRGLVRARSELVSRVRRFLPVSGRGAARARPLPRGLQAI